MGDKCLPDELRTLFLFEKLSDEQLATLCEHGHIATYEPGPICIEGEPATCFYVLIDGELVMSKRSGGDDIVTNRTSQRGVYCGAWSAFDPNEDHLYEASVRVTRPSRFFVLDAEAFGRLVAAANGVPVVLAGGSRLTDHELLGRMEAAMAGGAIGCSVGRNIFMHASPEAITRALSRVIRERWTADISWGKARAAKGADSCARVSAPCRFAVVETRHVVRRPSSE